MRNRSPRETIFTHLGVALGVVLLSMALAGGPLGLNYQAGPPSSMAAPVQPPVAEAALPAPAERPPDLEATLASSRGGRWASVVTSRDAGAGGPFASPTPLPAATAATPRESETARVAMSLIDPADAGSEQQSLDAGTLPAAASPAASAAPKLPAGLRVGLQVGHWKNSELPAELASLRGSTGAEGNGWSEVNVNLDVANRAAALLKAAGLTVDLIPATVPVGYKANAFVAIHCDGNSNPTVSGYKLARARWSRIPDKDDSLISAISQQYALATGLREHTATITENMRQYYAFDYLDLDHAVAPTTPSVILEMGFLTTASDRKLLLDQPGRAAEGVADGILKFLRGS